MNNRNFDDIPTRKVQNIKTKETVEFSIKLTPEEAVISAHAYLTLKDADQTSHKAKYEPQLVLGKDMVSLGDWQSLKAQEKTLSSTQSLFSKLEEESAA